MSFQQWRETRLFNFLDRRGGSEKCHLFPTPKDAQFGGPLGWVSNPVQGRHSTPKLSSFSRCVQKSAPMSGTWGMYEELGVRRAWMCKREARSRTLVHGFRLRLSLGVPQEGQKKTSGRCVGLGSRLSQSPVFRHSSFYQTSLCWGVECPAKHHCVGRASCLSRRVSGRGAGRKETNGRASVKKKTLQKKGLCKCPSLFSSLSLGLFLSRTLSLSQKRWGTRGTREVSE